MTNFDYSNLEINPDELKSSTDLDFRPLESRFVKVLRIESILVWFIIALIPWILFYLFDMNEISGSSIFLYSFVAWSVVSLVCMFVNLFILKKALTFRGYSIREMDLTYRKGIILTKYTTLPYSKIQQVNVKQGLFSRIFGFFTIELQDGSQLSEGVVIRGLSMESAEKLRDFIMTKIH